MKFQLRLHRILLTQALPGAPLFLAALSIGGLTLVLIRRATGGAEWATWGKVVVFGFLILAGLWIELSSDETAPLTPFFPGGGVGLLQAMGFTFIALQGFEVIATIAGEVDEPRRNLPRAMLLSLGAALLLYLPLLFVTATVGVAPGDSIMELSKRYPETVMALAAGNFLGPAGYWLVVLAAVLSTLSALHANLLAASRVSLTMARDGTLPPVLTGLHRRRGTPLIALYTTALAMVAIVMAVPDLASAGAAASLIFLCSFALAHGTCILARQRAASAQASAFRTPWFPLVPVVGGVACLALALFQAVAVPAAGVIAMVWLGLGVLLYLSLFSARAETADALAEARDPSLSRLRGRAPLILVPVANPERAAGLVEVANALVPAKVGRVLLLSVVLRNGRPRPAAVESAQRVLGSALDARDWSRARGTPHCGAGTLE